MLAVDNLFVVFFFSNFAFCSKKDWAFLIVLSAGFWSPTDYLGLELFDFKRSGISNSRFLDLPGNFFLSFYIRRKVSGAADCIVHFL